MSVKLTKPHQSSKPIISCTNYLTLSLDKTTATDSVISEVGADHVNS